MSVRDADPARLHPTVRARAQTILSRLKAEGLPFDLFEAFRTPQRQAELYAKGRTTLGDVVTYARSWESYHQYGLAVDIVLKENGNWSWDDQGARKAWWDRLHAIGREEGLEPLDFETPHLQLRGITKMELMQGHYPDGGDSSWVENLAASIDGWSGVPAAPPVPLGAPVRPALSSSPMAGIVMPPNRPVPGQQGWHRFGNGQEWRYDGKGLYLKSVEGGKAPLRTAGRPLTCRRIVELMGDVIMNVSNRYQIPAELLIMTVATETGFARDRGFTGPTTFRWEAAVNVTDTDGAVVQGDYSAGPMQTLASTARWVIDKQDLAFDAFAVAPIYRKRPAPPDSHPLYEYGNNIEIGAAEIRERWTKTGADPILVAAAYNAGGLYKQAENPWGLKCTGDHLDRAARWYSDACAVIAELA